jgi:hypothetical protein
MGSTLVLCSLLLVQQSAGSQNSWTGYDDQSRGQQLEKLRERLGQLQQGWGQLRGNFPQLVNPPQLPNFFMKKAPLPQEDRSNWVPKQFNGQTFYLVPCTAPSARPTNALRTQ